MELERQFVFIRGDNPIYNSVVLDLVFNYLDIHTLKSCRCICTKWREPATRSLLNICTISLDAEDTKKLSDILAWMTTHKSRAPFKNIICDKITHHSYPNIWPLLGNHVKSFTISHWWDDSKDLTLPDYEDLLLRRCPALEEISLPCTRNFKKAANFLICANTTEPNAPPSRFPNRSKRHINLNLKAIKVTGHARPDARFWRIVSVSPKLRRLHVECQLCEEFWNPALPGRTNWVERMKNLREMEIRSYANEGATSNSTNYYVSTPWNLTSACYECYDLSDKDMQDMHEHNKDTLVKLRMVFFNRKYDPWPHPGRDWMTSPKLIKLKNYHLEIDEHCKGPIFCLALVHAILVPNLKTLTLSMYEDGQNQSDWEEGLFTQIFAQFVSPTTFPSGIRREALRSIVLPPGIKDTSFVQPLAGIFPNLKELTLPLPSVEVMSMILAHWKGLERLRVTSEVGVGVQWNYLMTGVTVLENEVGVKFGVFNGATIVNLEKLTSFDMTMVGDLTGNFETDGGNVHVNDLLIYNGLIYLKWIQNISVRGQKFSKQALTFLRSQVHPFCHLNLEEI